MLKKITNHKETFKDKEKLNIHNNYLVGNENILETKEELLYANGFFTKNDANNMYVNFDPLSMTSIELAIKMIYLLAPCLSAVITQLYNRNEAEMEIIIKRNFRRFREYFDIKNDISGDVMFQMKLMKYILNENIDSKMSVLPKKKIIILLDGLITYRNLLSHQVHKKKDYEVQKKKSKKRSRSDFHKKHKIRNYNVVKKYISNVQYIINVFYKNKKKLKFDFDIGLLNRNYILLRTIKKNLDYLCMMRERRKKLEILVKDEEMVENMAQSTLDYLQKKLKDKKTKKQCARNVVNLITTRMVSDTVFKKHFGNKIDNKSCKKYCREL